MSKKPCFRGLLDREHGKLVETKLQAEWQQIYKIYQSQWRQLDWKKTLLVIHKIVSLFVNTLTVDEKHYLLKRDNSTEQIQTQLYQKQKSFPEFFVCILKIYIKF